MPAWYHLPIDCCPINRSQRHTPTCTKIPAGESRHSGNSERLIERNATGRNGRLSRRRALSSSQPARRNPLLATDTPGSRTAARGRATSRGRIRPERSGAPARIDTLAGWLADWRTKPARACTQREPIEAPRLPVAGWVVLSSSSETIVVLVIQKDLLTRGFDVDGFSAPKITAELCFPSCRARKLVERERG